MTYEEVNRLDYSYRVLVGEIAKRNYKKSDIAKSIGVTPRTFYSRLIGKSDFTLSEASTIQREFFPDMDKDTLFRQENTV